MSGEWLIRQRATDRDGATVERVTIENTAGGADPRARFGGSYVSFEYTDGRELIFPYANILRAEYRPHTQP